MGPALRLWGCRGNASWPLCFQTASGAAASRSSGWGAVSPSTGPCPAARGLPPRRPPGESVQTLAAGTHQRTRASPVVLPVSGTDLASPAPRVLLEARPRCTVPAAVQPAPVTPGSRALAGCVAVGEAAGPVGTPQRGHPQPASRPGTPHHRPSSLTWRGLRGGRVEGAAGRSWGTSPRGPFLLAEPIPGAGQGDAPGSSAARRSGPRDVVGTLHQPPQGAPHASPPTHVPGASGHAPNRHGYSSSEGTAPTSTCRSCLAHGPYRRQGRTRGLALAIRGAPLSGPAGRQDLPLTLELQQHPKAGCEATAPADGGHWPAPSPREIGRASCRERVSSPV